MLKKLKEAGVVTGVIVLILAACYALSWIVTCGLIKLITMCFGWDFSWLIATGIWLVICLIKPIFTNHVTVKK